MCTLVIPGLSVSARADFNPQFGIEQSESASSDGFSPSNIEQAEPPKKINISSTAFAKYRRYFSLMCQGLKADGRSESLFSIMDLNAVPDENCLACRPLLRTIANACKPKAIPKPVGKTDAEGEQLAPAEVVISTPIQREPNLAVLDSAVRAFGQASDEFKYPAELLKAADRLEFLLTAREGKTVAEREYFDILASYIRLPIKRMIRAHDLEGTGKPAKSKEELDALFDF